PVPFAWASDGVLEIGPFGTSCADAALWVQGQERYLCRVDAPVCGQAVDSANRQLTRFLRASAVPHRLDDAHAAANADDFFAHACSTCGPGGVVHIEPVANEW